MKFHRKTFLSRKLKLGKFPCHLAFFMENGAEEGGKFLAKFIICVVKRWDASPMDTQIRF